MTDVPIQGSTGVCWDVVYIRCGHQYQPGHGNLSQKVRAHMVDFMETGISEKAGRVLRLIVLFRASADLIFLFRADWTFI